MSQPRELPVMQAIRGQVAPAGKVVLTGELRSLGTEIHSLHPHGAAGVTECIAVILSQRDRERFRVGRPVGVKIVARLIRAADMGAMFPDSYGLIEGRPWSGTNCHGAYVAFAHAVAPTTD
jgi:hypothetical protein